MPPKERYSLIWLPCGEKNGLAERFGVPGFRGNLPFFISGRNLEQFEKTKSFNIVPSSLLKGLLYGIADINAEDSPVSHFSVDIPTYLRLLDIFNKSVHPPNMEEMIGSTASSFRNETGVETSLRALEAGITIAPESSALKMSLVFDLWVTFAENPEDLALPKRILTLVPTIKHYPRIPDNLQVVRYYGFCSTAFLGSRDELEKYKVDFVDGVVIDPDLIGEIELLLSVPNCKTPKELLLEHVEMA